MNNYMRSILKANLRIKVLIKGTVIILITVPFLFGGKGYGQNIPLNYFPELTLKKVVHDNFSLTTIKFPAFEGMTNCTINETAVLTSFAYRLDTLNTDSAMTVFKQKDVTDKKFRMKKSPTKAVLFSALVPGAGQFYNESYWKIPIIGGFIGYFGYEYFRNNNLYRGYKDQYIASQTVVNPNGNLNLKTLREFYRDQRDDFVWYFLIVYVINMVDAYVDAHLFDFDVRDEKYRGLGNGGKEYRLKLNLKL